MTMEEIGAKIGDAMLTRSENNGYWHLIVERERNGHRYRYNNTIADDASHEHIANIAKAVAIWWSDTIADQPDSSLERHPVEDKEV